ncbi:MAG: histidine phosphatase family protein [Corynebacterium sp.]|uniref:histidine phosphatase family protein n=1 Tax=Corynebacterium sp. TaxID=1720 RepID=UPI0026DB8E4A|nr:histidine phosphatase family protein [Corynebacterium sp.]MDO4762230.1 histidine phosphatase family protein [Corynebacterium sp.]
MGVVVGGRLIVMRHGRTHANARAIFDTQLPGAELTVIGREQAVAAGRRLGEVTGRLGCAVSSYAMRAQQTMMLAVAAFEGVQVEAISCGQLRTPVSSVAGIHEIFAGDIEGSSSPSAHQVYMRAMRAWLSGDFSARMPGGESAEEFLGRAVPTLRLLADAATASNSDTLVVAHGAAIRLIGRFGTDVCDDVLRNTYVNNASLTVIEPRGDFGQWHVSRWADTPLD